MKSYWQMSAQKEIKEKKLKVLEKDIETDVCIIGGGLSGISTAYYLKKADKDIKIVVLEKDNVCSHTSGHTTGKVTSQHGLFYNYLIQSQGEEYAKKYLEANEKAIDNIELNSKIENIDCDFKRESCFVFTRTETDIEKIQKEFQSVKKLGKEVNLKKEIKLPISDMKCAIEFKNQAKFHPIKYALGLCNSIIKEGGEIFENSKVIDIIKENNSYIVCTEKNKVKAKYVVMATRYPIKVFPGYYFLKMYQSSSYAIVADTKTEIMDGMYISSDIPTISFRTIQEGNKKLLLVVGYDYKTGKQELDDGFRSLEELVCSMYPDAKIINKWISEDCITLDKIPYIGEFSKLTPNMYVITGFNKWGITSSDIAANIVTDEILNKEKLKDKNNIYSDLFRATRIEPIKNREEVKNMIKEATESIIVKRIEGVENPICTHLGCELSYNPTEDTWDCPCHGSRFTRDGISIESPSVKNLKDKNIDAEEDY